MDSPFESKAADKAEVPRLGRDSKSLPNISTRNGDLFSHSI